MRLTQRSRFAVHTRCLMRCRLLRQTGRPCTSAWLVRTSSRGKDLSKSTKQYRRQPPPTTPNGAIRPQEIPPFTAVHARSRQTSRFRFRHRKVWWFKSLLVHSLRSCLVRSCTFASACGLSFRFDSLAVQRRGLAASSQRRVRSSVFLALNSASVRMPLSLSSPSFSSAAMTSPLPGLDATDVGLGVQAAAGDADGGATG